MHSYSMQFNFEKLEACACVFQNRLIAFAMLETDPGAFLLVRRVSYYCVTPVNHFSNP